MMRMNLQLEELLFDDLDGIITNLEQGQEEEVTEEQKEQLINFAKNVNSKIQAGENQNTEMLLFADVFDTLRCFQDIDWIRDYYSKLKRAISADIKYTSFQ